MYSLKLRTLICLSFKKSFMLFIFYVFIVQVHINVVTVIAIIVSCF